MVKKGHQRIEIRNKKETPNIELLILQKERFRNVLLYNNALPIQTSEQVGLRLHKPSFLFKTTQICNYFDAFASGPMDWFLYPNSFRFVVEKQ
jgi:hypothetical protein